MKMLSAPRSVFTVFVASVAFPFRVRIADVDVVLVQPAATFFPEAWEKILVRARVSYDTRAAAGAGGGRRQILPDDLLTQFQVNERGYRERGSCSISNYCCVPYVITCGC
ncbi:hypothetical protein EVAR_98313_1 [Eumeta japonica]|uniref:Uncharacterized protein n=1 Tax=Eumeta variegata TaxID=151549 RepID=A0A4C1XDS6_EUMVA|nr:hypothetical protein EVAR_98313_1 [Eumeta japonica]